MKKIDIDKIRGEWREVVFTTDGKSVITGGDDTIESIKMVAEKVNRIIGSANNIMGVECMHIFKYSHQEKRQTNSSGCNETIYDVVVCEKCGKVARTIKFN